MFKHKTKKATPATAKAVTGSHREHLLFADAWGAIAQADSLTIDVELDGTRYRATYERCEFDEESAPKNPMLMPAQNKSGGDR